jgi:O-6-methylguanine DNA methyltransferase
VSVLVERIIYGFHVCDLGEMSIAQTDRGICWLGFVQDGRTHIEVLADLKQRFYGSSLLRNDTVADNLGRRVIRTWEDGRERSIEVDLRGTDFQIAVWRALMDIGRGYVCAYSEIAEMINRPDAVRAVGTAVGVNPVSIVVPCHRVIQKNGKIGNYGWGVDMKRRLLTKEGVPKVHLS